MNTERTKSEKTIQEIIEFGIINIDKPSGPTSFDVSDFVRKSLGLRKTSHFGTLDPKVTGVLPIALNRACKLTGYFIGHNKEYVGIMRVHGEVPIEKIRKVIKEKFIGVIKQTPPVKSRVARREREREIKNFDILEQDGKDFLFFSNVQGGTYIRKLIDDLGKELGAGAHMLELRRVNAGIFSEDDEKYPSVNLYDFEKAVASYKQGNENLLREIIILAEEAIKKIYPVVEVKEDNLRQIFTGKPVYSKDLVKKEKFGKEEIISVFCRDRFVGMYKITDGKDIFAKSEFVMQEIR